MYMYAPIELKLLFNHLYTAITLYMHSLYVC